MNPRARKMEIEDMPVDAVFSVAQSTLRCDSCSKLLLDRIYLHKTLGSICNKCRKSLVPDYRGLTRDRRLEKIYEQLKILCENCNESWFLEDWKIHPRACLGRTLTKCASSSNTCDWRGPLKQLPKHFAENHPDETDVETENDNNKFSVDFGFVFDYAKFVDVTRLLRSRENLYYFLQVKKGPDANSYCFGVFDVSYTDSSRDDYARHVKIQVAVSNEQRFMFNQPTAPFEYFDCDDYRPEQREIVQQNSYPRSRVGVRVLPRTSPKKANRFRCYRCNVMMTPPIYVCDNERTPHKYCEACKQKVDGRCPFSNCKNKTVGRDRALELDVPTLDFHNFECRYGCVEYFSGPDILQHESRCALRRYACVMDNCPHPSAMSYEDLARHLREQHAFLVYETFSQQFLLEPFSKDERKHLAFMKDGNVVKLTVAFWKGQSDEPEDPDDDGLEFVWEFSHRANATEVFRLEISLYDPIPIRNEAIKKSVICESGGAKVVFTEFIRSFDEYDLTCYFNNRIHFACDIIKLDKGMSVKSMYIG